LANNVRIPEQPKFHSRDVHGAGTVYIEFPLRWENSWRSNRPKNHDAVWLYVKCWDGAEWRHAYLHDDSTRHHFGRGAGVNHQRIKDGSSLGVQTQYADFPDLMELELGRSSVQLMGVDENEERVTGVVGVFVYRRGNGRGTVELNSVNLFWNYRAQGFELDDELAVKVFAIEMVYIPEGYFYLGGSGADATQEWGSFTANENRHGFPFRVNSEDQIRLVGDADENNLWTTQVAAAHHSGAGIIPAAFPKGFKAFYIMKYEMTQEAYADFLNTLDFARQDAHTGSRDASGNMTSRLNSALVGHNPWNNTDNPLIVYRNHLVVTKIGEAYEFGTNARWNAQRNRTGSPGTPGTVGANFSGVDERPRIDGGPGNETRSIDGQDLPINFVSWYNLLGFADFAGLRPMTELEFEKASRGPLWPVAGEFAWGNVFLQTAHCTWSNTWWGGITPNTAIIQNFNTGDERFSPIYNTAAIYSLQYAGNWGVINAWRTVYRVGAMADSTTNRQASGATYWGVMNMTDNVNEMVVNATFAAGQQFDGRHGDGVLKSNGDPCATHRWPTATGSFYARGWVFAQSRGQGNQGTTAWNTNAWAWTWWGWLGLNVDAGRTSNRSGVTRLVHFQNNNPAGNFDGGIRLVRTQNYLRPGSVTVTSDPEEDEGA